MKRLTAILLIAVLVFAFVACGVVNNTLSNDTSINNSALEEILTEISDDFDSTGEKLSAKLEDTKTSIGDTYEGYSKNNALIKEYYELCLKEAGELYERTQNSSIAYYKLVAATIDHDDSKTLEDAIDWLYETVYEGLFDAFYEVIYEDAFGDLYDTYYEGIIDDAEDSMEYKDWLDIRTAFYSDWLDARSDFYGDWLDSRSNIYSDYLNIKSEFIYGDSFDVDDILNPEQKEEISNTSTSTEPEQDKDTETTSTTEESDETEDMAYAPDDWVNLLEKHYEDIKKQFENAGFTNIICVPYEIDFNEDNVFEGSVINIAVGENGDICTFEKGEQWPKDITIRIYYRTKPAKPDMTEIVLPQEDSKLGKDFDTKGTSTVYYINTDNITNKPSIAMWDSATITDGVEEYLNHLQELGFTVTVTDTTHEEPYSGYHTYETNFKVSNDNVSWTMCLYIQKELYVEYELDIHLN